MDKDYLFENYIVKNRTEKEIAEELGCTEGKIDYWARKYGFNFKRSNPDKVFNLKHIDNTDPIFCYYAGLVAADGYLDYKNKRISLRVNNVGSYDVLNCLKEYFEYIRPVRIYYNTKYNRPNNDLTIPNACIFEELKDVGIFGKKNTRSFSIDWFNNSTDDCKRMFIRGVIDGDGNIHNCIRIAMKSQQFMDNLLMVFNNMCDDTYVLKMQTNQTGNKYPMINLHKQDSINLLKFIYEGFEQYRFTDKYNKYLEL